MNSSLTARLDRLPTDEAWDYATATADETILAEVCQLRELAVSHDWTRRWLVYRLVGDRPVILPADLRLTPTEIGWLKSRLEA